MISDRPKKDYWDINGLPDFWHYVELLKSDNQLRQSRKTTLGRIRDQKTNTEYIYNFITAYDLNEINKKQKN